MQISRNTKKERKRIIRKKIHSHLYRILLLLLLLKEFHSMAIESIEELQKRKTIRTATTRSGSAAVLSTTPL